MYRRMLVPLDGSTLAEAVMPHVIALAQQFASEVTLVQVVTPFERLRNELLRGELSALQIDVVTDVARQQVQAHHAAAQHYLDEQINALRIHGITAAPIVIEGDPATAIVHVASEHKSDLIAMASHGRGGLSRLVYGSVADRVLRTTPCPLLLVRSLEHDSDDDDG